MASGDLVTRLLILAEDRASRTLKGLNGTLKTLGVTLAAFFTGKTIGNFFADVVKGAGDIQTQFLELEARTGATAAEIEKLKQVAADLGASDTLAVSTKEAAEAMTVLGTAGQSASEIIASIEPVLALAQGAMLDADQAATIVTQSLAAFNLEADQSGRVADVLTGAANSAATSVDQIASALGYAAPAANAAKMSIETLVGIIAKMQGAGIEGTRAGTAMNTMLAQLADPASKASVALQELGADTTDFMDVLRTLEEAGPAGEAAILAFGTEAGPALRALLGQGIGSVEDLIGVLRNSEGATLKAAETMNRGWRGAMDALGDAWEALKNSLGEPLLDPISEQARKAAQLISDFANSQDFAKIKTAVVDAFNGAADGVRNFLAEFDWSKASQSTADFVSRVGEWMSNVETSLEGARKVAAAIILVFDGLASGANLIISALKSVWGGFQKIGAGISGFAGAVSEFMSSISKLDSRKAFWNEKATYFQNIANDWRTGAKGAFAESEAAFARFKTNADGVNRSLQTLGLQAAASSNATAAGAKQIAASSADVQRLNQELDDLGVKFYQALNAGDVAGANQISDQMEKVSAELRDVEQQATEASAGIKTIGEGGAGLAQIQQEVETLSAEFDRLRDAHFSALNSGDTAGANAAADQLRQVSKELATAQAKAQEASAAVAGIGTAADAAANPTIEIETNAAEVEQDVEVLAGTDYRAQVQVESNASEVEQTIRKIGDSQTTSVHTVRPDTSAATAAINALKKPTSSTHTIYIRKVEKNATGGPILSRATGGSVFRPLSGTTVPGVGNQDSVPRALPVGSFVIRKSASRASRKLIDTLLTPGERVIPPRLVRRYGSGFWDAINNLEIPRFASGGLVGPATASTGQPARDAIDINLTIGSQRVQLQGARAQAQALAGALRELNRA